VSALAGCRLVIGSSARLRSLEWPLLEPPEAAQRLLAEAAQGEVALVFGRESSGLTNAELARCHFLVHIPTDPEFSSLNLAAAVQVSPTRSAAPGARAGERIQDAPRDLATAEALEGLNAHLAQALADLGFADPAQSQRLLMRLRRLFNRARPDWVEINILRGILSAAQGRKSAARPSSPGSAGGNARIGPQGETHA
jgi:tRNA (cytidine32/uridine32-2'-O)-methyltransferase